MAAEPTAGRNFSPICSLSTSIPVSTIPLGRAIIQWSPSSITNSPVSRLEANPCCWRCIVFAAVRGTNAGCTILRAVFFNASTPPVTSFFAVSLAAWAAVLLAAASVASLAAISATSFPPLPIKPAVPPLRRISPANPMLPSNPLITLPPQPSFDFRASYSSSLARYT